MTEMVNVEIAGKSYPLLFSVRAAKEAFGKFGDLAGIQKAVVSDDSLDEIMWLLALLLREGARYAQIVEGREVMPPNTDELETLIPYYDMELRGTLLGAILNSSLTEIELEQGGDPKNAPTTQSG